MATANDKLIRELQEECNQLRQALADVKLERDCYRQMLLEELRSRGEFEDLDITTLEAMSAGPVELLE